ncbi:hypothetical protein [Chryseobacterium sp. IT-36CA2]|uniref:hypothetical protein n=1 Tax=Chryseobacterium sp. IT-36CA2 TaxID=3026460 RepID=UPI0039E1B14B
MNVLPYSVSLYSTLGEGNIGGRGFDTEENRPTNLQTPMKWKWKWKWKCYNLKRESDNFLFFAG